VQIKETSVVAGVIVLATTLAIFLTVVGCTSTDASTDAWAEDVPLQRMQASPQHRDGRFVNPLPVRMLTHPESRHLRRIATVAGHLAGHMALT